MNPAAAAKEVNTYRSFTTLQTSFKLLYESGIPTALLRTAVSSLLPQILLAGMANGR
jgi:hypothetical protein